MTILTALEVISIFGAAMVGKFLCSSRVYQSTKPLEREYRILNFKNYAVLYTVNEKLETVEICRVFNAKRNYLSATKSKSGIEQSFVNSSVGLQVLIFFEKSQNIVKFSRIIFFFAEYRD